MLRNNVVDLDARRDRAMLLDLIRARCSKAEAEEALSAMRQIEWAMAGHVPSAIAWLRKHGGPEWRA